MTGAARTPLVSVLLPTRNAAGYLPHALSSLWAQTHDDFEVLVIDDGSTDGTDALLLNETDPRLVVLRGSGTGGVAAALNTGLGHARGSFIARMDADDLSVPERLQRQLAFLEQHPRVGVVGSNISFVRADGRPTRRRTRLPLTPAGLRLHLHIGNCLPHPTAVFRRGVIEGVGGYRTDRPAAEDYDLWLRLLGTTELANVESCLLRYRQHGASVSSIAQEAGALSVSVQLAELLGGLLGDQVAVGTVRRLLLPNEPIRDDADMLEAREVLGALDRVLTLSRDSRALPAADVAAIGRRHDYVTARLIMMILKHRRSPIDALRTPAVRSALGAAARGGIRRIADPISDALPGGGQAAGRGVEGNQPL